MKRLTAKYPFWLKALCKQAAVLAVAVCFSMGATDPSCAASTTWTTGSCAPAAARRCSASATTSAAPTPDAGARRATRRHRRRHERPADLLRLHRQVRRDRAGRAHHPRLRPGGLDRALRGLRRGPARHHPAHPPLVGSAGAGHAADARGPIVARPCRARAHAKKFAGKPAATEVSSHD